MTVSTATKLSPKQQSTFESVNRALGLGNIVHIWGQHGMGKTTVLSALHREDGGVMLGIRDFVDRLSRSHPLQMEEALYRILSKAVRKHPMVFVDDLHLVTAVVCCNYTYQRQNLLDAPLAVVGAYAAEKGTKLVFCHSGSAPKPLGVRAFSFGIGKLGPEDYRSICRRYLPESTTKRVDFARIHQFASKLNGHQLRASCQWLRDEPALDTDRFIEYVRSQRMATNVDIEEVEAVDLSSLKGIDDVIQNLEANVVVPVEKDALARELDLRPTRGVLLVGPPGTGKTTIGKALAHRLRGKFFLIDGTYISGTRDFYERVHRVFAAAKENAPSIVFIDDSDVIFENSQESGLYRYLLTQLDGLEGKGKGHVCVILTAMDVGALPPALIRSGRIELWLQTRLPDPGARSEALRERLSSLHSSFQGIDIDRLVEGSEGFTGADLKGLIERGKMNLAYDRARGAEVMEPTTYFLAAADTIRENQERYREAEARARSRPRERPPWFYPSMEIESAEDYE
jgi:ATP-dependent 26S proteasome regulatory subunit